MLYSDTEVWEVNDILNVAWGITWMFVVYKPVIDKIAKLMLCNQIILVDSF